MAGRAAAAALGCGPTSLAGIAPGAPHSQIAHRRGPTKPRRFFKRLSSGGRSNRRCVRLSRATVSRCAQRRTACRAVPRRLPLVRRWLCQCAEKRGQKHGLSSWNTNQEPSDGGHDEYRSSWRGRAAESSPLVACASHQRLDRRPGGHGNHLGRGAGGYHGVRRPHDDVARVALAAARDSAAELLSDWRAQPAGRGADRHVHRHGAGRAKLCAVPRRAIWRRGWAPSSTCRWSASWGRCWPPRCWPAASAAPWPPNWAPCASPNRSTPWRSMGANPIHYLVVPRFLGCLVLIPTLTIMADFMGVVGGWFYSIDAGDRLIIIIGKTRSNSSAISICSAACSRACSSARRSR